MLSPATCQVPAASTTPMGDLWGGGIRRPTDPWARHSRNRGPRTPNPRPDTALRSCAARLQSWWELRKGMLVVWGWPSRRSVGVGRWVAPGPRVSFCLRCKVSLRRCSRPLGRYKFGLCTLPLRCPRAKAEEAALEAGHVKCYADMQCSASSAPWTTQVGPRWSLASSYHLLPGLSSVKMVAAA